MARWQVQKRPRRVRPPKSPVRVDPCNPQGVAVCDGCGRVVPYPALKPLFAYAGTPRQGSRTALTRTHMYGPGGGGDGSYMINTGLRMCPACQDVPNEQYRYQALGPDPLPLEFARPDTPEENALVTENDFVLQTEDDDDIEVT